MGSARVTHLSAPDGPTRVSTGAIQFGDDWPGLFVRGDDAIGVMLSIRDVEARLSGIDDVTVRTALSRLKRLATIIDCDVIVRRRVD